MSIGTSKYFNWAVFAAVLVGALVLLTTSVQADDINTQLYQSMTATRYTKPRAALALQFGRTHQIGFTLLKNSSPA